MRTSVKLIGMVGLTVFVASVQAYDDGYGYDYDHGDDGYEYSTGYAYPSYGGSIHDPTQTGYLIERRGNVEYWDPTYGGGIIDPTQTGYVIERDR